MSPDATTTALELRSYDRKYIANSRVLVYIIYLTIGFTKITIISLTFSILYCKIKFQQTSEMKQIDEIFE